MVVAAPSLMNMYPIHVSKGVGLRGPNQVQKLGALMQCPIHAAEYRCRAPFKWSHLALQGTGELGSLAISAVTTLLLLKCQGSRDYDPDLLPGLQASLHGSPAAGWAGPAEHVPQS